MNWLQFETDGKCSGRCAICPKGLGYVPPRQKMSWDTIERLVREVVPQVGWVYPFLYQEPLMEPRLIQILRLIKMVNPRAQTCISTTMAGMTGDLAAQITRSGLLDQMTISFYGPDEETLARYQPGLNFMETSRAIRGFMAARNASGTGKPRVRMHYITTPDLMEKWQEFRSQWTGVVDDIVKVPFDTFCGTITGFPELLCSTAIRAPCYRLTLGMTVLSSGDMVPCCLDFSGMHPLGNINLESPLAIWNGPDMQEIRVLHDAGRFNEIPLCRDCSVWRQGDLR